MRWPTGLARDEHAEVAYGQARAHVPGMAEHLIGAFPPRLGQWTFALALYHAGLRCFERELVAAPLAAPSDWFTAERMLRVGHVRFAHVPEIVSEIYPAGPSRRH